MGTLWQDVKHGIRTLRKGKGMAAMAVVTLTLAAVGIYGVISYGVAQRTREIGVRVALGAQHRDVLRLILNQGMALTIAGVALGAATSIGLNRFLANLLFEVEPTDGTTYGVVCVVLVMVALLACVIPARRAMRVEPVEALRYE